MTRIRSMTGYGASTRESDGFKAGVTVRSLNHRYLDLSVHLSRRVLSLEPDVRKAVQARLHRGRVEVSIHAARQGQENEAVSANGALIAALVKTLREVQHDHGLRGELQLGDVLRFPGAFEVEEPAAFLEEGRRDELMALLGEALDGLEAMRAVEGARLEEALLSALQNMTAAVEHIERVGAAERGPRVEALQARARLLTQELSVEEPRLYQELARLVDKQDVAEEIQRLRSHVAQVRDIVAKGGPAGKRLDFLAQELGREANTIGSKSDSAALAQGVVALKVEIERFREQVQNVE